MIIEQPSSWLRWIYPDALWRMDPSEKAVYLTFDDGPIPEATPEILDILRQRHIKATFFMVGDNVRKHPREYQMVVDDGHRIGNHTFNHIGGLRHGIRGYLNNVDKADTFIHSDLVRPPYGWLKWEQYLFLRRRYQLVMWDLTTRDYSKQLNAQDVVCNVKRYARNGSIITFHDSLRSIDKLHTALPKSLDWLIAQGYQFKTFPVYKKPTE